MIDPNVEKIYNIILSIFLGIVVVMIFNQLFDSPRVITLYKNLNTTSSN